ncbi:hypothetical protein LENED_004317 [Lentinula edodes]|uniref:GmrSD restriction endonucleases N-terminal domain-containing protein n=1 Tax=Lentinula edodes TaxID=5353 RepID=A0A1Q3E656_LENED|nr:hypothetical protein LENED_004317 [Lentinula edodes]
MLNFVSSYLSLLPTVKCQCHFAISDSFEGASRCPIFLTPHQSLFSPIFIQSFHASVRSITNVIDFEMPKALKRPRDATFSVRSLYDDIKRGLIDVNPEYQRDVVWKAEKQIMLIDSVFTNHYMPPIIFSVSYEENGTEVTKICLDGKQRLTSLQLFIDGAIPLKHPETSKLWWFKNHESSTSKTHRNIIPERIRQSFLNRQIRCTEYEELDEEDEREIFRRVQLGMALSTAEKLRIRSTRHAKFINELRELYVTESGLAAPSFRWDRSRDADYRCLAQAVYALSKWGPERNTALKTTGTLSQVEKWLDDDTSPMSGEFADQVKQAFSILVQLTVDEDLSKPFLMYKKVSPMEIIGVVILIYVHSIIAPPFEKLTLPELSAAVAQMRQDVRREHKDIRLNDRVGKTVVTFADTFHWGVDWSSPTKGRRYIHSCAGADQVHLTETKTRAVFIRSTWSEAFDDQIVCSYARSTAYFGRGPIE